MTTAVAIPASITAPRAPVCRIGSRAASSAWASCSELIMVSSIQWRGAQLVGVPGGDRGSPIAPGRTDIGDDGGDFVVAQILGERRHAEGHRILSRPWRITAVQHHAD